MRKAKVFLGLGATSSIVALALAGPVLAWHPKGVIVKQVQNQTTNSVVSDANDAAHAVAAKPGDVLRYVIEVRNEGAADSHGYNDMAKVVIKDTLPTGVELVSNPSQRQITADLGTIKPGAKVTRDYIVRVITKQDGALIENKACFTGDSTANDNPQQGCDVADVKVKVPVVVVPPATVTPPVVTPPTQSETTTPTPVELPATGLGSIVGGIVGVTALGLGLYNYLRSRKSLATYHQ